MLDLTLIGELALVILATMQLIKSHPRVKGSAIPYLSGVVGVVYALLWFLVNGRIYHDGIHFGMIYEAVANGVVSAVSAITAYNAQKEIPFVPNLLPTATELDASKAKENS